MTELEVKISADIKRLRAELAKAENDLKRFGGNAEKEGKKVERAFQKTGKSATNVTPTLLEFNRVIQDAPFGIQGVANNLTQLTQNFGDLRKSAGGTRAALSSLVAGFAGPAGILFAVSAVTSLLVAFGDKLFSSTNKAEKLKEKVEQLNEAFSAELSLNKAIEDGLKLQGESTTGILNERRKIVLAQLQSLSNIIEEQRELLKLKQQENERVSNYEILAQITKGIATTLFAMAKLSFDLFTDDVVKIAENLLNIEIDRSKFAGASKEDKKEEQELENKLFNLLTQKKQLENDILRINQEQSKEKAKQFVFSAVSQSPQELENLFGIGGDALSKLESAATKIGEGVNKALQASAKPIKAYWSEREAELDQFAQRAEQSIRGSIGQSFATLGQVIGEGLINGANVFSTIGQGIIAGFGQFLSSMGQLLIEYGTMAVLKGKLDIAIAAGGPLAIGAGLAAIAAGVALSAIGAAFSSAASGGFSGAGSGAVSGQGSTNTDGRITNSGGNFGVTGSSGGTVVFEIQGNKLVGVLNNTLRGNSRLGGNLALG